MTVGACIHIYIYIYTYIYIYIYTYTHTTSTTFYIQVLIHTAERTGATMSITKLLQNLKQQHRIETLILLPRH